MVADERQRCRIYIIIEGLFCSRAAHRVSGFIADPTYLSEMHVLSCFNAPYSILGGPVGQETQLVHVPSPPQSVAICLKFLSRRLSEDKFAFQIRPKIHRSAPFTRTIESVTIAWSKQYTPKTVQVQLISTMAALNGLEAIYNPNGFFATGCVTNIVYVGQQTTLSAMQAAGPLLSD